MSSSLKPENAKTALPLIQLPSCEDALSSRSLWSFAKTNSATRAKTMKGRVWSYAEDKFTKQSVIDYNLTAQVKERQEMEKKLNKLGKTMDYMERAKREEETPIFEQAFQQRLVEEQHLHEQEQLKEIELSRQHHAGDLQEKNRLARMLENKVIFQQRIDSRREAEFNRLKQERDDRIREQVAALKRDREIKRKLLFFLKSEEERLTKLREEEEARKREEAERKKKEDAEKQAKLDEIFEKQKQRERELEEKDRLRREALLAKTLEPPRPAEPGSPARPEPAPAAATAGKYVPRHRRLAEAGQGPSAAPLGQSMRAPATGTPDTDRWTRRDVPDTDRWSRRDGPPPPAGGDRYRSDDSRPPPGVGGGSKLPWRRS